MPLVFDPVDDACLNTSPKLMCWSRVRPGRVVLTASSLHCAEDGFIILDRSSHSVGAEPAAPAYHFDVRLFACDCASCKTATNSRPIDLTNRHTATACLEQRLYLCKSLLETVPGGRAVRDSSAIPATKTPRAPL